MSELENMIENFIATESMMFSLEKHPVQTDCPDQEIVVVATSHADEYLKMILSIDNLNRILPNRMEFLLGFLGQLSKDLDAEREELATALIVKGDTRVSMEDIPRLSMEAVILKQAKKIIKERCFPEGIKDEQS